MRNGKHYSLTQNLQAQEWNAGKKETFKSACIIQQKMTDLFAVICSSCLIFCLNVICTAVVSDPRDFISSQLVYGLAGIFFLVDICQTFKVISLVRNTCFYSPWDNFSGKLILYCKDLTFNIKKKNLRTFKNH